MTENQATESADVTIRYDKKVYSKRAAQDKPLTTGYLYNLEFDETKKTMDIMCIPNLHPENEEPDPNHIPKWCRKELRRDKHMWRKVHKTFKDQPGYFAPYFAPIPDVPHYQKEAIDENENTLHV